VADIHIVREHSLGLPEARKLAFRWAEVAEQKLDMECTYAEGKTHDLVTFKRPGASGELKVTRDKFDLSAKLGLLLGVFKGKIESEIVRNLDELLQHEQPLAAFEQGLAHHEAKKAVKHHAPKKAAAKKTAAAAKKVK
jgi:putative polyhydroxyalkanoate system protein